MRRCLCGAEMERKDQPIAFTWGGQRRVFHDFKPWVCVERCGVELVEHHDYWRMREMADPK